MKRKIDGDQFASLEQAWPEFVLHFSTLRNIMVSKILWLINL